MSIPKLTQLANDRHAARQWMGAHYEGSSVEAAHNHREQAIKFSTGRSPSKRPVFGKRVSSSHA